MARDKNSTPETVKSRVTRQAEYILHLAVGTSPYFNKHGWQGLDRRLGGCNEPHESPLKLTDVWHLPTATGANGHGAEFPISLPGRCISLASNRGDLVLDPFVGSGTSALAAMELGRHFVGLDVCDEYIQSARVRVEALACKLKAKPTVPFVALGEAGKRVNGNGRTEGRSALKDKTPDHVAQ